MMNFYWILNQILLKQFFVGFFKETHTLFSDEWKWIVSYDFLDSEEEIVYLIVFKLVDCEFKEEFVYIFGVNILDLLFFR